MSDDPVYVDLDTDLLAAVEAYAAEHDLTLVEVVHQALQTWLANQEP